MAAAAPHSPAELTLLATFLVYTLATAGIGLFVLVRWSRLGGLRTEPTVPASVPVAMIALSVFVFWIAEPFAQETALALFGGANAANRPGELISELAGQAFVFVLMSAAWFTLPQSIAWAPTIAPEGEPIGPVDELRPAWRALGFRSWARSFLALCALALAGTLAWKGIYLGWEKLHGAGLVGSPPLDDVQDVVESAKEVRVLTWEFLLLSAVTVVGAPIAEELVFRGALYPAFKSVSRRVLGDHAPMFGAVLTGLLFSQVHMTNSAYLTIFLFGWFLCLIRDRYGLLTCMAAHAAWNLSNLVWLKLPPDLPNL